MVGAIGAVGAGSAVAMLQRVQYASRLTAARAASAVSAVGQPRQENTAPAAAAGSTAAEVSLPYGGPELPYVPEGYGPEDLASRAKAMFPQLGVSADVEEEGMRFLNSLFGNNDNKNSLSDSAIGGAEELFRMLGTPLGEEDAFRMPGLDGEDADGENVSGVKESKKGAGVRNEEKCETCARRKYQDGSDDPGVSFKTAQHVDPGVAGSAVRGHEMEHVVRERAKAERKDRKVVSQSVTFHMDICPECGRFYVSGGTTRTVTAADNSKDDSDPLSVADRLGGLEASA